MKINTITSTNVYNNQKVRNCNLKENIRSEVAANSDNIVFQGKWTRFLSRTFDRGADVIMATDEAIQAGRKINGSIFTPTAAGLALFAAAKATKDAVLDTIADGVITSNKDDNE